MTNHYRTLQVDPSADQEVIEAAYRRLAQRLHPDVNDAPDAVGRMKAINEAYRVLKDPVSRAEYDRHRPDAAAPVPAGRQPVETRVATTASAYKAEISRANPACFVFLVDQSQSMSEQIGGGGQRKAEVVADAINRLLTELAVKCAKEEGVRDYFHIGLVGYGGEGVRSAFSGGLAGRALVPIGELADSPARVETRTKKVPDGAGGLVEITTRFPVWMDPATVGGTPMCTALQRAESLVGGWLGAHPNCFPPIVLNLTDGQANDGDPEPYAASIRGRGSSDGAALLFNLHVSETGGAPVTFPDAETGLPDAFAQTLFRMSSPLPPGMLGFASEQGFNVSPGSRGFVYNADIAAVVQFLDIGTRASDLR